MVQRLQHRRFTGAAAGWAPALKRGEIAVNTVRREIMVGEAHDTGAGTARSILAIRIYDDRSQYVSGELALQAGLIYKANTAIGAPEAFNASKWDQMTWTAAALNAAYATAAHLHTGVYSPVGHNHDASYAALVHTHDLLYSPLGHNHDASYAAIGHNHDTVYARIDGSVPITGSQVFTHATSIQTTGKVSVGAGSAPGFDLQIQYSRASAEVSAAVINTHATGYALYRASNGTRSYWWGVDGGDGFWKLVDATASVIRLQLGLTGGFLFGAPTGGDKGAGTINAQAGIWDNNVRVATQPYADASSAAAAAAVLASSIFKQVAFVDQVTPGASMTAVISGTPRNIQIFARALPSVNGALATLRLLRADGGIVATVTPTVTVGDSAGLGGARFIAWSHDCQAGTFHNLMGTVMNGSEVPESFYEIGGDTSAVAQVQVVFNSGNVSGNIQVFGL